MILKNLLGSNLHPGNPAPQFCLQDQNGKTQRLSDYRGRWVVLFFYPKDASYFCTQEVCSFRDESEGFASKNVVVLGISTDDVESHKRFADGHKIKYPLLADFTQSVSQNYGVLMPFGIAKRTTFLINPEGQVAEILNWVNWFRYGARVAERLSALGAEAAPPA